VSAERRVHVIGAGLAGLSAAVHLARAGRAVALYEGAGHAGGRCRSYDDDRLGRRIDNGNHLVLSGNEAVQQYLNIIGASDSMTGPVEAAFPFVDLEYGIRWTLRPDRGVVPWSIFCSHRRVPGTGALDYLGAWRLARVSAGDTLADCLKTDGQLWRRFWRPLAVSILNTEPAEASAELMWAVVRETFGRGRAACRPLIAREGLSESFVTPALEYLRARGAEIRFNERVRELEVTDGRVTAFTGSERVAVEDGELVVLAVPPAAAERLLPDLTAPNEFQAIVNGHFVVPDAGAGEAFVGIVGGTAEWLFRRGDVVSITVSAGDGLAAETDEAIAIALWADIRRILGLAEERPGPHRIIREKRATFRQTPAQCARRPTARTALANLWLAGDWTDTGLPATIEGTLRSGRHAAESLEKA